MLGKQPVLSAVGGNYKAQIEDNSLLYQGNGVGTERRKRLGIYHTFKSNKICWWIELRGKGKRTGQRE